MLIKEIHKELERVRELKKFYDEIPMGFIGASMIDLVIKKTEKSIEDNNVVLMLKCYEELKTI